MWCGNVGINMEDPLASQVTSDESDIVQQLPGQLRYSFMRPARMMAPFLSPFSSTK